MRLILKMKEQQCMNKNQVLKGRIKSMAVWLKKWVSMMTYSISQITYQKKLKIKKTNFKEIYIKIKIEMSKSRYQI